MSSVSSRASHVENPSPIPLPAQPSSSPEPGSPVSVAIFHTATDWQPGDAMPPDACVDVPFLRGVAAADAPLVVEWLNQLLVKLGIRGQWAAANAEPAALCSDLPPLKVDVYRDGEYVRTFEVTDPRSNICRTYNDLSGPELEARPRPAFASASLTTTGETRAPLAAAPLPASTMRPVLGSQEAGQ